jgi:hypothetical protein
MVLQELALIEPLLKHQGPTIVRIVELHWRDFAVFVSLSSRTNTRQGLCACAMHLAQNRMRASKFPILFRKSVRGL